VTRLPSRRRGRAPSGKSTRAVQSLTHRMLRYSIQSMQKVDFLREVCRTLLDTSGADVVEMCARESEDSTCWHVRLGRGVPFLVDILPAKGARRGARSEEQRPQTEMEAVLQDLMSFRTQLPEVAFTKNDGLWEGRSGRLLATFREPLMIGHQSHTSEHEPCRSLILAPLEAAGTTMGVLGLMSRVPDFFTESDIEFCEDLARTLGIALMSHHTQAALRERVKELTCLYGISQLVEATDSTRDSILNGIVKLIPPAWQYPEITVARIVVDGKPYSTPGFRDVGQKQTADIVVEGQPRGTVEVVYLKERPLRDEGPFLKEERSLIEAIAREIAHILERETAERQKRDLQEQLLHSERLATVGELAAGVAHELNEPLGSILGFAQLARKYPDLPAEAAEDLDKIIAAALHARDVIRKLLVFARQKSPNKVAVNLNQVVEDSLYFLSPRCTSAGIQVKLDLDERLPSITADPVQLHQALINLIINAVHAMPNGGTLRIATRAAERSVTLTVRDSGIGMSEEVAKRVFLPFFTTKDVDQGTGLGLSLVHGIVASHGGTIAVDSEEGRGTTFKIVLPVTWPPRAGEPG